ncbi:Methylenetetrahydrofolate--tRNA-(Uracil-5-)-methyltransferase TrmFO [Heracleum sosnowskyi]|uniref:Methylenetetrahydrofolate--tRNA-(Uracil-5-)-methyltransferase TrmFO n=1 Tax=Heracleum sosnowskyi TaxID=360622 RepID=A0AAD8H3N7_9APIA|nr:Methylenetetrahydrofolate--tRNA-(Uracil-5-)-methyltransferase TrmFO [Heracleum sosnowskyi]
MACSVPNSPWLCPLKPTKTSSSWCLYSSSRSSTLKPINSSSDNSLEPQKQKPVVDPVKLAFDKAKSYKKFKTPVVIQQPQGVSDDTNDSSSSSDKSVEPPVLDPVKLAFEKSKAYKESKTNTKPVSLQQAADDSVNKTGGSELGGASGKRKESAYIFKVAMEKAKDYETTKGGFTGSKGVGSNQGIPGSKGGTSEISRVEKKANKKEKMTVSSIDFVGLNFSDKRSSRGLPPGLVPVIDPFSDTDEVEIIVGDASKFGATTESNPTTVDENQDVYKPKVSTWGVFPRPSNISKTYGGGKVIRPGEALETAEDKASKEARTRQLLAAYKKKVGLNIDPKLKSECQKVLNDGDLLMDRGMLEEALPFYESVMEKLPFQTELHGLAALQWSICQDSLTRMNDARVMYEKLQSHPNVRVSKQARDFVFGFQAMEMLKVRGMTPSPTSTGYQNYFDAFVKDKTTYSQEENEINEGAFSEVLPYMVFLCCPILIVLLIAVQKGI